MRKGETEFITFTRLMAKVKDHKKVKYDHKSKDEDINKKKK